MAANYIYGDSDLVDEARLEFADLGTLSVAMFIRLNNAGLNADTLIERFTNEANEE